jgi:hypothetical protein
VDTVKQAAEMDEGQGQHWLPGAQQLPGMLSAILHDYTIACQELTKLSCTTISSLLGIKWSNQTSKTGHCLIIVSTLHDFNLVFLPIYNFSPFIFIFDFQEMGGGGWRGPLNQVNAA